jgi:hypothetical protein
MIRLEINPTYATPHKIQKIKRSALVNTSKKMR